MTEYMLNVPLDRYEELLELEAKVDVIVAMACHKRLYSIEDVLWMLGTELSVEIAHDMQEEREESLRRIYREEMTASCAKQE